MKNNIRLKLVSNFSSIDIKKNFTFSALNLAFLSFLFSGSIKIPKNLFLWCDGITGKFLYKVEKIAGNEFLKKFYNFKFSKVIVLGNYTNKQLSYLNRKFNTKVSGISIPKVKNKDIKKFVPKIERNTLVLITLPTPKQEILSNEIIKKSKYYKILCIGGGLSIATGEIRKCPKFLYNLGLEFLWRLRTDTIRRLKRLIVTLLIFTFYLLIGKLSKLKVIVI